MKKIIGLMAVLMLVVVSAIVIGNGLENIFDSKSEEERDVSEMMQELRDRSNGSKYQVFNVEGADMTHVDYFDAIPYRDDFNFTTYEIKGSIKDPTGSYYYGMVVNSLGSYASRDDITLDKDIVDADLWAGDKIMVIFENSNDAIVEVVKISDSKTANNVDVVEKHGFMVLDRQEKDDSHTTIAVEIKDGSEHGFEMADGEVVAENIFDYTDFVVLTKEEAEGLKMSGIYLITFSHDYVDTIVENDLVIANKVFGQVIGDEI